MENLITDAMVKNCLDQLDDWGGVTMTPEQVKDLISKDRKLLGVLVAYYSETTTGLDTQDREILLEAFARDIAGGSRWPMYGDSQEVKDAFMAAVLQAVKDGKLQAFNPS
jgi:hypothetical protein